MKKIIFSAMAIAAVAVSCQVKDLDENTSVSGESFTISAELPETKTIFNENDKTVAWENNDKLSVVINSASAYTFTKIDGENTFEATNVTLADGTNTFHALYPYNNNIASIDNETGLAKNTKGENLYINIPSQEASSQNAINSTSHIKGVMYGYTEADLTETPSIQMHQLTALLKIAVTNNHTEPITIRSITVSTDAQGQLLSGTFYINLKDGSVESSGDSYTFSSTTLGVTGVTMETGETGTFWVSANQFSVPVGSHLTISVETDKGSVTDERSYEQALNFVAGTVNTAEFDFSDPKQTIEKLTVAEFLAKEVDENTYYELTGTVSNISSDYHGNFDLVDETGSVYVYGISSAKGAGDKNVLANLGIKAGDAITICGTRGEYGSTVEVMNAYYISHTAAPYCDVTPSSLGVSSEAGTTTFEIKSNESWTIASSNPAYTVSPASGDSDATIEVSYPANEGEDAVEVTFTVTSESGEKTVTLTHRSASQTVVEVTDVLTADLFTATNTSYTNFSEVQGQSGVLYSGNTAKNNNNIRIRSEKDSGIITTKSTGIVRSVSVEWVSTTDRTLNIYGSNTPYNSTSELYDNAEPIATISYGESSVNIDGEYAYIGMRSSKNMLEVSNIKIVWEVK